MKKRMLMLAAACMTVVALVGCGAPKAPTLEELKDNISDKTPSSYEMTGSVEAKASMKVVDPSEDTQMVLDMVEDQYGIDLTDKVDVAVSVDVESNGQRNEECSYVTSKGTINFKSKNSVIQDLIDEQLEEEDLDNLNRENYTDYEEEIRYTKSDDGDWYYEDYEPDDKDDDDKTVDAFGSFIDYCVAHNENDEEDQITIEVDGDEFVLKYAIEINNEFAESVDKNEKKALQDLLDNLEIEIDLEDAFDMVEEYGEYAEVAVPFDMELRFADMGTKKDRDFVFTGVKVTLGGSVNCDWDEEMVADIFEQAGMPLDSLGNDVSFGLELGVEATLSIDATIKYNEEIELEIPSKVTKNAVEKDEYFGSAAVAIDDEDWTVDEDDEDDVVATTDDDVKKANADGSYTLCDYNGDEVAKLNVPDGWTVSEYASDSYIPMNNDETFDSLYITCSVPSGIIAFYDEEASDYDKEKMEEYEYLDTIGDYDFYYRAEFDEVHAIKYMEENSSVCIYAYVDDNKDYYVINTVEDFEELIEDNF